jgi:hypothetical protein
MKNQRVLKLLRKQAGVVPEVAGTMVTNAFTSGLSSVGGGLAAAVSPTKDIHEIARANKMVAANFIPGVGPYNLYKRLGNSLRGPEMEALREEAKKEYAKKSLIEKYKGILIGALTLGAAGTTAYMANRPTYQYVGKVREPDETDSAESESWDSGETHKDLLPDEDDKPYYEDEYFKNFDKKSNELTKEAGWKSEKALGTVADTATLGTSRLIGLLAAAATPTKTRKEIALADEAHWDNFIPGVAAYREAKRMGNALWGPEIQKAQDIVNLDDLAAKKVRQREINKQVDAYLKAKRT